MRYFKLTIVACVLLAFATSCTKTANNGINSEKSRIEKFSSDLKAINAKHSTSKLSHKILASIGNERSDVGGPAGPTDPAITGFSWTNLVAVAMADIGGAISGGKGGAWVGARVGMLAGNPEAGVVIGAVAGGAIIGGACSYDAYKGSAVSLPPLDPLPTRDTSYAYNSNVDPAIVGTLHDAILSALIKRDENGGSEGSLAGGTFVQNYLAGIELSHYEIALIDSIDKEMDLDAFVKQRGAAVWDNNDDDVPEPSSGEGASEESSSTADVVFENNLKQGYLDAEGITNSLSLTEDYQNYVDTTSNLTSEEKISFKAGLHVASHSLNYWLPLLNK
ncbi:hypothetical protein [Arachidicoccus terrestris]|uniref:hypothetical protein n=1 Tax=Arachidicoccus terrestris TaxID=2875539 RepID=UPI001CC6F9A9|nr:hypothetical protein [Arachidicoccus terrestris]UAY53931.1 hypothetical protein K9M52_10615 [Arachidicoccus terrestris]